MFYWFSLLQCWLLQLQLYMTLLYSYSLHMKSLTNSIWGNENKQQVKLKCVLIDDGGNYYLKHELKSVMYNHTSTGILISHRLGSLQMLAKHEEILISAVKQFYSSSIMYM